MKNTKAGKVNKVDKEKELFAEDKKEAVEMVENKDTAENQEVVVENKGTDKEPEMEMELDSSEVQDEMEELVAEKIKKEEIENKEQKSKRGPKPGAKAEKEEDEKKPEEKKEKALNFKDSNIIQREIKKGRLSAPQGRIEKTEAGDYVMKLADGVIFPQDAKGNLKEVGKIAKMNDGKYVLTKTAADNLKTDKFTAKHENGEEVEHDWVRVELHKPGREKDVVELFTVKEAKTYLNVQTAKDKKKEEEAKKKAEKEKADKEAADKAEKEAPKDETPKEEAKA